MKLLKAKTLNLENLYKNGKGRRSGKEYKYLTFPNYGIKVAYDPYDDSYCLLETGLNPDEAAWIYYYRNQKENSGEIICLEGPDYIRIYSGGYIAYMSKENFNLCLKP